MINASHKQAAVAIRLNPIPSIDNKIKPTATKEKTQKNVLANPLEFI